MTISKQYFPFLNIALYLNNVPLIRELVLNNNEADWENVSVYITADIPFIEPLVHSIAVIPAGARVSVPLKDLKINRHFITRLSETEKAVVKIEVTQQEKLLATDELVIAVHPLEYFGGFQLLPELVAAYVTPNHSYVYHIKRRAAAILEQHQQTPAFDGYQSNDPERVLQYMSAIYTALQQEEIVYSALAPGYEENGQRLRLLTTIQRERFGNCIDISLLFAACLEAVGLHPVLIIVRGYAFVGCWLQDELFAEIVNDDKTAVTKRLSKGIRELAAIEATAVCKGSSLTFTDALNKAEAQLVEKDDFVLSVDIMRARTARIRPLPLLADTEQVILDEKMLQERETALESRFDMGQVYAEELLNEKTAFTKQKLWERKLLDLSLRNNLLNLRMTRNMLQLADVNISTFEDLMSDGKGFHILPDARADILRKYNVFMPPLHHSSPIYTMVEEELKHNRLVTYYHQLDLENILSYMHKTARQAIEENGSSTLYIALGLLKWYDKKTPDIARYAPILLLPVEMGRRSVNSKFTLKSREEETMINITLLEFLRQEYELDLGILEQLPADEKGVDVAQVMGIMRRAVMPMKGWDVEEQLVLGNFSFSKLILWKDIAENTDALLKNKMVQSLIEGRLAVEQAAILTDDPDSIPSSEVALPIATDVSQLEAIRTAQQGSSFILHGPPGTGKSQTITNIIADALYRGKRVLFVAAKKAALDVVYKRLEQIGLAPFSLELHSNKSRKSDILKQLEKALEVGRAQGDTGFGQEASRLDAAKEAINEYVKLLHQPQLPGWSLYDSITTLETFKNEALAKTAVPVEVLAKLNAGLWQQWNDWLPEFNVIIANIIHPQDNPLSALKINGYTQGIQDSINAQTEELVTFLPVFKEKALRLATAIGFPYTLETRMHWEQFMLVLQAMNGLPDMPLSLMEFLAGKENFEVYEEWNRYFEKYQQAYRELLSVNSKNILTADIPMLELEWRKAQQSWFLPKWLKKRKVKKQLSLYRNVSISNDTEVVQLFQLHEIWRDVAVTLQQQRFKEVIVALKGWYKEEDTNLTYVDLNATLLRRLAGLLELFEYNALRKWVTQLRSQQYNSSADIMARAGNWEDVILLTSNLEKRLQVYQQLIALPVAEKDWMSSLEEQLKKVQAHLSGLKNWMNYRQLCEKGTAIDLKWLITAFEDKKVEIKHFRDFFFYSVHDSFARHIIAGEESLSLFNAALFESKVEHYKKLAKEFQELSVKEVRNKLAAQLPDTTVEAMQSSEIGILQRAIKNKGRGMSIRRLFDQLPVLLPRLSPCMLMSPISVAQYFDISSKYFDLVIFDEASQLPTCEAVSALARADQAIVVGDPKQMPPTSFFATGKTDEDNMEVEDLESILDDCLSLSVPSRYLLRHYRSKHESLIAFSNANYYENKLLTFPSADDLDRKVQYHHVPGFYDKGKSRTNSFEAEAIVRYIQQHYQNPEKRGLSLGVVTFSQTQQSLVEDRLQQLFMADASLEKLANEAVEPLFIKNLENVQGDERDIILFSVGYAPDEGGKMSMNFGPLNRNGGWRRLNVAVTRARYEMHVFATLRADQIRLERTAAEGVAGLKAFLQYAENGQLVIHADHLRNEAGTRHLSEAIAARLVEAGLQVKTSVGTSDFKIDIGIINPHKPETYLMGIVVDGHYYYKAATANDREMVMPAVLKGLGWNIYRIWSLDWHEHATGIVADIIAVVAKLKEEVRAEKFENVLEKELKTEEPVTFPPQLAAPLEVVLPLIGKQQVYKTYTLRPVAEASSEKIYDYRYRNRIKRQLQQLIETEAPISKGLMIKKLLQGWNIARLGGRLDKHLDEIIAEMNFIQTIHHQPFYWSDELLPEQLDYYRNNETEKRSMEDIAPEEIIVALEEVVRNNLSIEEDELLRYLSRTFGFAKLGKQIDSLLRYGVDLAERQGKVKRESGRVIVL